MLLRTHIAFAVLIILIFISHINSPWIFILMVLAGTVLPDLDTNSSSWGRHFIFRPLQFFIKHRGIIHSLTIAAAISILFSMYWPVASLGFFVGYSFHIVLDSFTREGIQPFWPLKAKSYGFISSGGRIEDSIFIFLILTDIALVILIFAF